MSEKYETVVGIETHVQLKTKSKLFCGCDNDSRQAKPNTNVCPVCLGLPGTLPVLNRQALKLVLRAGLALNGRITKETKFDRKNYFYPDLPKGYQITQYDQPVIEKGLVDVPLEDRTVRVGITRAHLEEDAGKLTHPNGADYSLVDLNRAGTPLMEIVSEPDIHSPAEAKAYTRELYNLMRYADVSDCDLFHGHIRFDVNVSVHPRGSKNRGIRTETKNLNSFRAVERVVEYESDRQIDLLQSGHKVIQETRGWDETASKTYSQRRKEESHDYRYFPEPDLPPLVITQSMIGEAKKGMLKSLAEIRMELWATGLDYKEREALVSRPELADIYLSAVQDEIPKPKLARRIAFWLTGEEAAAKIQPSRLWQLSKMIDEGQLSSSGAKTVLGYLARHDVDAMEAAMKLKLIQRSDVEELELMIEEVIKSNPQSVGDYKAGKVQALQFLVGQVMSASHGQANPLVVNDILKKRLGD